MQCVLLYRASDNVDGRCECQKFTLQMQNVRPETVRTVFDCRDLKADKADGGLRAIWVLV